MMERVELSREVKAVQIPAGTVTTLEKGLEVFITQSLGGTYTVQVPALRGSSTVSTARMPMRWARPPKKVRKPFPQATSKRWCGISSRPATTPRFR